MTVFLDLEPKYIIHAKQIEMLREKQMVFSNKNTKHLDLVDSCVSEFEQKLAAISAGDEKIFWAAVIGVGCFVLSGSLPILTFAFGAFAIAAYQMGQRVQLKLEYQQALENLVECARWAIGDNDSDSEELLQGTQRMVSALAEVTTENQRKLIFDKTLEVRIYQPDGMNSEHPSFIKYREHRQEIYRKLYGYEEGRFEDVFQAVVNVIKNWLSLLFASVQKVNYQVSFHKPKPEKKAEDTNAENIFSMDSYANTL